MTDIVQALREGIEPYEGVAVAEQVMEMAADKIELLQEACKGKTECLRDAYAQIERLRAANDKIGIWMAAALDDPNVCQEMKRDINAWFDAIDGTNEQKAPPTNDPTLHELYGVWKDDERS